MTRMHFEAIAATLASLRPDKVGDLGPSGTRARGAWIQWRDTVKAMAVTLKQFNAGFQPARFYKACGLED